MIGTATRPERLLGERIEWHARGGAHLGTVWSAGPLPRSVWVLPEGFEPGEVFALVKLRTNSRNYESEVRRMTREEQRREVAKFEALEIAKKR